MIIIRLKGGLGNQLFQYAFGRFLAIKNNTEIKYTWNEDKNDTQREYKLDQFNTKIEKAGSKEVEQSKNYIQKNQFLSKIVQKITRRYNIGYVPNLIDKKTGYLEGFWQSYKYLDPIKNVLLEEIVLKENLDEKYKSLLNQIHDTASVSVHIRRSDYVQNQKMIDEYCTFGIEYYQKAIQMMKEKIPSPTLFVFSDDIHWAKEHLQTDIPIIFVSSPETKDYEELILMSTCKHNIIANSTFSFWGAYINRNENKIIIAPQKWNNTYQKEYADLLPEEWIKI